MKKLLVFISTIMLLFGCNRNGNGKLEQKIEAQITKNCNNGDCTINLSDITSFKWTRFYVFKETASLEGIEKAINQKYPYFADVARRLIFLDESNNIVYREEIFPNVEGVENKEVIFYVRYSKL